MNDTEIEKEFEEKFLDSEESDLDGKIIYYYSNDIGEDPSIIRNWVLEKLHQRDEKWRKGVEGLKKDTRPLEDGIPVETYGYEEEYNNALERLFKLN